MGKYIQEEPVGSYFVVTRAIVDYEKENHPVLVGLSFASSEVIDNVQSMSPQWTAYLLLPRTPNIIQLKGCCTHSSSNLHPLKLRPGKLYVIFYSNFD
jgi:hypothetical protein